ncbi:hypothetical protein MMC14_010295 [Varicellaria rhodocarpa]|nr:hypothetical protein [Varicellaria rhodocarpa]
MFFDPQSCTTIYQNALVFVQTDLSEQTYLPLRTDPPLSVLLLVCLLSVQTQSTNPTSVQNIIHTLIKPPMVLFIGLPHHYALTSLKGYHSPSKLEQLYISCRSHKHPETFATSHSTSITMCLNIASYGSCGHLIRVERQSCALHFNYKKCRKTTTQKQLSYTCDDYMECTRTRKLRSEAQAPKVEAKIELAQGSEK